jgi:hypothetical protein
MIDAPQSPAASGRVKARKPAANHPFRRPFSPNGGAKAFAREIRDMVEGDGPDLDEIVRTLKSP